MRISADSLVGRALLKLAEDPRWSSGSLPVRATAPGGAAQTRARATQQAQQKAQLAAGQKKEAQAPAAAEAVLNAWARLPAAAKGAIIGAPIGAVTTGSGEMLLNRQLDDGSTPQQHMYGSLAERARAVRDASDNPGLMKKLLAETGGHAENLAGITAEHPVKSALIAALLGGALGAGVGAGSGATLRMLPRAAAAR